MRNLSEFMEESEWIYWGIRLNLLRNQSEFIEESEWIYWRIWVNLLRNPSEFIEESVWIQCGFQLNLFYLKLKFGVIWTQMLWLFSIFQSFPDGYESCSVAITTVVFLEKYSTQQYPIPNGPNQASIGTKLQCS